jgi:uncharacterized protein
MLVDQTDIFEACRRGEYDLVQKICEEHPDIIHVKDFKGFTPLIIAVYNNQPAVVDYLLQKGAKVEMQDQSGNTALMGVCFRGYTSIVKQLINAGVDVNQRNFQGATALTFAATFGHLEIARLLLDNGAAINVCDVRGKSPLDHAIIQENDEMTALLQSYLPLQGNAQTEDQPVA